MHSRRVRQYVAWACCDFCKATRHTLFSRSFGEEELRRAFIKHLLWITSERYDRHISDEVCFSHILERLERIVTDVVAPPPDLPPLTAEIVSRTLKATYRTL